MLSVFGFAPRQLRRWVAFCYPQVLNMYEYYGWASIPNDANQNNEEKLKPVLLELENKIKTDFVFNDVAYLNNLNGTVVLNIAGNHNHRNNLAVDLFTWIAQNVVGSFGLLYIMDDEDNRAEKGNRFLVWRLARGVLQEFDDPFLSPFIPIVEDTYEAKKS